MHLLLFEPNTGGHHGLFVQHVVNYWHDHQEAGRLELLVAEDFLKTHRSLAALLSSLDTENIRVHTFEPASSNPRNGSIDLISHDLSLGRILKRRIESIRPTHCLLMYFDHLQLSLGFGLRFDYPLHIGGIYFRPSFHYPDLMNRLADRKRRTQNLRKKMQLRLALTNPHVKTLFSLDPYVVHHLASLNPRVRAVALPDGIEDTEDGLAGPLMREAWAIENDRQTAVLFGSLATRKGVFKVLEALWHLDRYLQKKLAVVFAGAVAEIDRDHFNRAIAEARQSTEVQLVVDDRFLDDAEVPTLMQSADLILATYQHHIGSSNILVRAAKAGVPVLGSDFGLVGEQIRRRRLGAAIDATRPEAIAEGLETYLLHPEDSDFDLEEALRFSQENTGERFAETIFRHLDER